MTDDGSEAGTEDRNIHVVEQGDGWEVWRKGDSMPLGSYVTQGEAEEQARAQAELDGVQVVDHDAGYEATDDVTPPTEI
ncbi:hypothetical protein BH10ACT1_BH10ACT1_13050 [soil metagenome]